MTINFDETEEFLKEFKRLSRKYKSIPDDLSEFKKVVSELPFGSGKHFNVITKSEKITIIKARLFCRYLKGSSLRIIYAFHTEIDKIEFIQIYSKSVQENENRERIKRYLKKFENTN
ncbi:MAG: hypothetical protein Q8Q17_03000 [bacterium]|nr:hypothetical protein [bacterium]